MFGIQRPERQDYVFSYIYSKNYAQLFISVRKHQNSYATRSSKTSPACLLHRCRHKWLVRKHLFTHPSDFRTSPASSSIHLFPHFSRFSTSIKPYFTKYSHTEMQIWSFTYTVFNYAINIIVKTHSSTHPPVCCVCHICIAKSKT